MQVKKVIYVKRISKISLEALQKRGYTVILVGGYRV